MSTSILPNVHELPPIGVLGSGSFGRGIAAAAGRHGREVLIATRRELTGELGANVRRVDVLADLARAELIFLAAPSQVLPEVARELGENLDGRHYLVHVSRGLVPGDEALHTLSQVLRDVTPCRRVGALAGPITVQALEGGQPSGGVIGTRFNEVATAVREAFAGSELRIYNNADVLGVEVASAFVGLLAVALGFAREIGATPETLAVFLSRAMVEGQQFLPTLGGRPDTMLGLAGQGNLLAVTLGTRLPEIAVGEALARGVDLAEAVRDSGAHIESVQLAGRLTDHARRFGIAAPITATIAEVLEGNISPAAALDGLMARKARSE